MKYIIVSPVYNEEKYLKTFINSIIKQTVKPTLFVLVDDNSSDNSSSIIKEYSNQYGWIKYIYRKSQDKKVQGSKVIEAFNFGIKNINLDDFSFIAKIDADLELPDNYFETISASFNKNSKYGIVGGYVKELENGNWVPKHYSLTSYHIRGALKSYRKECFKEINGLMPVLGGDGLDEMKALHFGWETQNLDLSVKHFRPAASDYRPLKLPFKTGFANYKNGGSLFLATVRSIVRIKDKPYFLIGFSYYLGYVYALLNKEKRNVDKELMKFINKFHLQRIFRK